MSWGEHNEKTKLFMEKYNSHHALVFSALSFLFAFVNNRYKHIIPSSLMCECRQKDLSKLKTD